MSRNDIKNKLNVSCIKSKYYPLAGSKNYGFGSNYRSLQTDNKPNFGAGGNRKVKVSLAKVNLPEEREE